MHTDLVGAAGRDIHLHQSRDLAEELHRLEHAHRILAGGGDAHVPLSLAALIRRERCIDAFRAELPVARYERQVCLVHAALAYQRVQRDQRGPIARHAQTPARVAVEAMHELETLARTRRT
jgi:hypothetical protein